MNNSIDEHTKNILIRDINKMCDAYCANACHKDGMCEFCSIPLSMSILKMLINANKGD